MYKNDIYERIILYYYFFTIGINYVNVHFNIIERQSDGM